MAKAKFNNHDDQSVIVNDFLNLIKSLSISDEKINNSELKSLLIEINKELTNYISDNNMDFDSILKRVLDNNDEAAELADQLLLCINKSKQ